MSMSVTLTINEISEVHVRASGGYAPDVMHDLQARAITLMANAASIILQMDAARDARASVDDEEPIADQPADS